MPQSTRWVYSNFIEVMEVVEVVVVVVLMLMQSELAVVMNAVVVMEVALV